MIKHLSLLVSACAALAFLAGTSDVLAVPGDGPFSGGEIYRKQCAECHGANGEGVEEEYDEPLYGDRSLASLTRLIVRTMPEDDAKKCAGKNAAAVARYIYHAFYSPEARAKIDPPRIALSRLTNEQYLASVADLVGRRQRAIEPKSGLRGQYFNSKGMDKAKERKLERIDGTIDFDFGGGAPVEGMKSDQFLVAWEGSIRARETGLYEFRLRTPNGARLYVNAVTVGSSGRYRDDSSNASEQPLIDAWVSSGNEVRQAEGKVFLLGGRTYPLRLDYFKYKEKTASIHLEWKPPHGVWETPSGADFAPELSSRALVVTTPFPADDRSLGYERGTSVSPVWLRAVTAGAIEVANEIEERLPALSGVDEDTPASERAKRHRELVAALAERAFRRPLTEEEHARYVASPFEGVALSEVGVKRAVLLVLQSPRFLFPDLPSPPEDQRSGRASRLALVLWDSLPDEPLLNAVRAGTLETRGHLQAQARRMLADPRARAKMRGFFHHWLEMDAERDLHKDKKAYPGFDEQVIADLRHSLNLFIDDVVWSEKSDYRRLLLESRIPLNARLAGLYGKKSAGGGFQPVAFDPKRRAGVLTHPYLLSAFAYPDNSSPIHRGVFLTRHIVGRPLKPPPMAVAFKDAEFDPKLSMREKVTELTRDVACMSCHEAINPLGFSLENYDAIGRWRWKENNKPINAKSDYETEDGKTIRLEGARDVGEFAASNEGAHRAFVTHLFHHLVKQPTAAYGPETLDELRRRFAAADFNIQKLIVEIALIAAMPDSTPGDS